MYINFMQRRVNIMWHTLEIDDVKRKLRTSIKMGLTKEEVRNKA